ncbi:MAG: type II toxin-antitoxin system HicB family antitoxin [Bacteroidia bacterium]|nr:type II toxin-antitoxin system HicB family antitoxin [Bacteroidia bacterium]
METIKVIIEKTKDMYSAYAENTKGIYAGGDTVEEVKQSVLDAIRLLKKYNTDENIPGILKGDYQIVYHFDTQSFLSYYNKVFTNVALERITGINQKLLHHYATGLKTPREPQRKKIENALHRLGSELLLLEL